MAVSQTVLIADDEDELRNLLKLFLQRQGYRVLEAEDGSAAWSTWEAHSAAIDLLVSDVCMPGLTGVELLEKIRGVRPTLPAVLISGNLGAVKLPELTAGQTVFLPKPFHPGLLIEVVQTLLVPVPIDEASA